MFLSPILKFINNLFFGFLLFSLATSFTLCPHCGSNVSAAPTIGPLYQSSKVDSLVRNDSLSNSNQDNNLKNFPFRLGAEFGVGINFSGDKKASQGFWGFVDVNLYDKTIFLKAEYGSGHIKLNVYDFLGRELKILVNESKIAGRYEVEFDGENLASGVYLYRIQAGDFIDSKKMILLK